MAALLFVGVVEQLGNESIFGRFVQRKNNIQHNTKPRQQAKTRFQTCMFAFFFGIGISGDNCHDKDASDIGKKNYNKGIHNELAFEGFAKLEHVVNNITKHRKRETCYKDIECYKNVLHPSCIR